MHSIGDGVCSDRRVLRLESSNDRFGDFVGLKADFVHLFVYRVSLRLFPKRRYVSSDFKRSVLKVAGTGVGSAMWHDDIVSSCRKCEPKAEMLIRKIRSDSIINELELCHPEVPRNVDPQRRDCYSMRDSHERASRPQVFVDPVPEHRNVIHGQTAASHEFEIRFLAY